ncbi:hypothetical protein, conserved [Leishmania donovani]|uniref:Uncharacterized protein n=1 Tax=Leishmania donovani TaxID=5661 RepID=E9BEG3_LEIDO|nr:hypothetical protein, conserved [Leishmania donovani]
MLLSRCFCCSFSSHGIFRSRS